MSDFWRGRRVLVTGGAGFVGANLCRALLNRGANVRGFDLRLGPSWDVLELPRALLTYGSVRNPWLMKMEFSTYGIEVVFHLAGAGHIKDCQDHPLSAWENNVEGTWAVLEGCRMLGQEVKAVVVASSNHVYGSLGPHHDRGDFDHRRGDILFTEESPFGQPDVYGTSKACTDFIARSYGRTLGIPVAALRHVNCFGKADPHRSHLVTGTICDLLDGKAPMIRGDGTPVKGYLAVEDVVAAYLLLGESLTSGRVEAGTAWNAAPEAPISVLALVELICHAAGRDVAPEILGEDLSQSHYVEHLDSSRLRALGWSPGSLGFWLCETWEWYKAQGGMQWAAS